MRNLIIYLSLLLCLFASKMVAQDPSPKGEQAKQTFETKAKAIAIKMEYITKEEKEALKLEIEKVNEQLEKGTISLEQANENKRKLAEARAQIIENKIAAAHEELKILVQEKVDGKLKSDLEKEGIYKVDSVLIGYKKYEVTYKITDSTYINTFNVRRLFDKKVEVEKRTTSQFVFATGINNLATHGDVTNSDFRYWGSHFYEWGLTYNSRILNDHNLLHAKYGLSLMYNNLRPTDNRFFVKNGAQTNLEESNISLNDSRLRNVYLVMPLHLEFDFSGKKEKEGKTYFKTHDSFRFGIGGYAGVRIKSKQFIEYEANNNDVTYKEKGTFNANNFIYGVSTYIGYRSTSLYVKYDLNPLFKDNVVKQNNVSLGIRFDFN